MKLEVRDVVVSFRKERQEKLFGAERQTVLNGVSFAMDAGEILALAGESGSGKSTLGRVISGLLRPDSGEVLIDGIPVYGRSGKKEELRNKLSIVFQDYTSSVNPRFRVDEILWESLSMRKHELKESVAEALTSLLLQVGLDGSYLRRYPHELSGGQLQRVCIARSVALRPELIVLDEAVSSLDAPTQVQVMDLLMELREKHGFSYLFITHDLTAVTYMCSRALFFNNGEIVERVDDIERLGEVKDDYAKKLLDSVITIGAISPV